MNIKVLGTRGEIAESAPRHTRHSGLLVDNKLLFDLGEKEYLNYKPAGIFITHLHPDHAFFITGTNLSTNIPVYAPEKSPKSKNIQTIVDTIHLDEYQVTPVPTHHSKLVKSSAYLIESGLQKVLYTGDLIWIDKEYHHLFAGLGVVITDGSYLRAGGLIRKDKVTGQIYGHNGIPDLIRLFKPFTQHILFVHFGGWFFKDIKDARRRLVNLGNYYGITVHVGYDSIELDTHELQ
jgi:hypothetical protein